MKILVIKEPSLLREGIMTALRDSFPEYEFLTADSSMQSELYKKEKTADFLIIDLDTSIDIFSLIAYYQRMKKKIMVWTSSMTDKYLIDLFKLNLDGYLFNGMEKEELSFAIQSVIKGKPYICHELTPILLNDYSLIYTQKNRDRPVGVFSKREWEVLELLTKGLKNDDIAQALFISEKTVKNHVGAILKKLKVPDRTNAVITAFKNKWFYV